MTTMTIKDLPVADELTPAELAEVHGGIGRTPQQILAHELTDLPATPDGRVLGPDGRLYFPGMQPLPRP
jgi:hypothetical protein